MFCVNCGREVSPLSERGLCHDCYIEKTQIVRLPEKVDVEVCVHCGSRKRGEIWLQPARASLKAEDSVDPVAEGSLVARDAAIDAADVEKAVVRPAYRVDSRPTDTHLKHWATTLTVTGRAESFEVAGSASTVVRLKGATCIRCSRRQGGYFEGVVQIRAARRDLSRDEVRHARRVASRMIDRIVSDGDTHAFVLRDEEIEGGLDVYFGTTNAARMIAKAVAQDLGGKVTEHAKIVGQKDGLDLYRITFAMRVPEYRKGDVVVVDDAIWLVQSIGSKTVSIRDPADGAVRSVERDVLDDAEVLAREKAEEAVVVSRTESELQVLDPRSYATVTVVRPAGIAEDAATVEVLRWEDDLIVLPARREETPP